MQKSYFDFEKFFLNFESNISACLNNKDVKEFLVAYSGGVDSTALLYLDNLLAKKNNVSIRAVHINHNLSKESNEWEKHCEKVCIEFKIPIKTKNINIVISKGDSIEERAREERYKSIYQLISNGTMLMTAHHADDQAETLLNQLFRGAGSKGMSAMPKIKSIKKHAYHIRPFLNISKTEINNFINYLNLEYIQDLSNYNINYSRNFIRKEIMPVIKRKWPSCTLTISRAAFNLAESAKLNEDLALIDIDNYLHEDVNKIKTAVRELKRHRFNNIIRFWIKKNNFRMPSLEQINSIYTNILNASDSKVAFFSCSEYEIRKYSDYLEIMKPLKSHDPSKLYKWKYNENLVIPDLGINIPWGKLEEKLGCKLLEDAEVRFRMSGKNINLGSSKTVKDYMREAKIPHWKRNRVLLIFVNKDLRVIWE